MFREYSSCSLVNHFVLCSLYIHPTSSIPDCWPACKLKVYVWGKAGGEKVPVCTADSQSRVTSCESIVTVNVFSKVIFFLLSYTGMTQPCATAGTPCPPSHFQLS